MKVQIRSQTIEFQAQVEAVREGFYLRGESVAHWARERGFRPNAVYQLLSGRTFARRGVSHRIALALGIKPININPNDSLSLRSEKEN